jgi:site-specific DNA-methyltransferase (adenine-specific)
MGEASEPEPAMIELHCGDCLEVMRGIADASVDLILTDLPYGSSECRWDQIIPLEPLWKHYKRLIKPRGAIVLTAIQPFTSLLVMSNREWFRYEWIWNKKAGTNFQQANYRALRIHENVLVFSPAPATFSKRQNAMTFYPQRTPRDPANLRPYSRVTGQMTRIRSGLCKKGRNYDPFTCFPVSILTFGSRAGECNASRRIHNTQKPVALMEYLIKTYTNEGDTVLDSCMGSGTTLVACLNTGRDFIGIEKDPEIFATAEKRIAAELDKTPLLAGS